MNCYAPQILVDWFLRPEILSELCELQLSSPVQPTPWDAGGYLRAFALTCLLESVFYVWALRGRVPLRKMAAPIAIANLATHPFIYFGLPWILAQFQVPAIAFITSAETFAPLLEAILLWRVWKVPARMAFPAMIFGNLFSWWVGVWLS